MRNRSCIVIGGGKVAERKIEKLIEAGAYVTVISPMITEVIGHWETEGKLVWYKRRYHSGDVSNYFLVIITTDSPELNRSIYQEVNHHTQLVNIADVPELCTFIVPSAISRANLQIAISTHGASPGLAKKIRKQLEETYGEEYGEYTHFLAEMREWILQQNLDRPTRQFYFAKLLEDEIFMRIQKGERLQTVQEIKREIREKRDVH